MSVEGVGPLAPWRIVEASAVTPVPWRNGGGVTRELLRLPAESTHGELSTGDEWMLRISMADIAADGPFSRFQDVDRWFTVMAGAGVLLDWGDTIIRSTVTTEPVFFDGGNPPGCRLVDGPTRDLNVMVRRDLASVRVEPARWQAPWAPRASRAGLVARVPLRLSPGDGSVRSLKAQALAWCDHVESTAWTIAPAPSSPASLDPPTASDEAPPGWWISLAPTARARR